MLKTAYGNDAMKKKTSVYDYDWHKRFCENCTNIEDYLWTGRFYSTTNENVERVREIGCADRRITIASELGISHGSILHDDL
ncbi:hypothetical protein TNCV_1722171 [Trichonephila clavipes]|nr:hypothetical protein TNCV_1722171 [Trichonephila clavipes]